MSSRPPHIDRVDLSVRGGSAERSQAAPDGRPVLQVWFRCSNSYVRVPRNHQGTGYLARCPSCGKCMRFTVGAGGTNRRFFEVSC